MTPNEYRKKCDWLAGFYAEAAETGRAIQTANIDGWTDSMLGPILQSDPRNWRLKPEPQKAWVVWCQFNGQWQTASFPIQEEAERFAAPRNGTIQEIERPEPQ